MKFVAYERVTPWPGSCRFGRCVALKSREGKCNSSAGSAVSCVASQSLGGQWLLLSSEDSLCVVRWNEVVHYWAIFLRESHSNGWRLPWHVGTVRVPPGNGFAAEHHLPTGWAPPHWSLHVLETFTRTFPDRWIGATDQSFGPRVRRISLRWIYFFGGYVNDRVYATHLPDLQRYETASVMRLP
jgi:hypothetical protein